MGTTPQDEQDQKITDRLQELTMGGEVVWRMIYDDPDAHRQSDLQSMSRPDGFIAQDPHHGFGRVTLEMDRMEDPHGKPALYVQGNRVNADEHDLLILLDAIQTQIDERREGGGMTPEEHIQKRVEEALEPLREENQRLRHQLEREQRRCDRLLSLLEAESQPRGSGPPSISAAGLFSGGPVGSAAVGKTSTEIDAEAPSESESDEPADQSS